MPAIVVTIQVNRNRCHLCDITLCANSVGGCTKIVQLNRPMGEKSALTSAYSVTPVPPDVCSWI